MQRRAALLAIIMSALLVTACAGPQPRDYADTGPRFDLAAFFTGPVRAWGIFQGRDGEVRRRFTVDIEGRMEGDTLVLDERFRYADGERQQRVWRIERVDAHHWQGEAGDIVGTAAGSEYGFALNWRYTLKLAVDGTEWQLAFDDWMYRIDEDTVINRAQVSKWGFNVGEVTLFFRKGASS
ncbi:DUF3833 domain-containing protein [Arhodomonas aquaeolei]|uniref:DUF3833 domain-containing protein n=1 Tax=Arhodomonas aquaeolei TaxID=2369 RepID=UPI00036EEC3D|nr:DUF3833 domain-containing protein [Arhodomonas aquaeolei]MCS4502618.1 DUF3833 domain-containing protein [Arhodomonas aquaeolei]